MKTLTAALMFGAFLRMACHAGDTALFAEKSTWETVGEGYQIAEGLAGSKDGMVYLTDVPASKLLRIDASGKESVLDAQTAKANGLANGPDGLLYAACMGGPQILFWNLESGERGSIALPTPANDLVITADGRLYYTWGPADAVYQLDLTDPKPVKVGEIRHPNGITLSHDGKELWVGAFFSDTVHAFPILADGTLGPARPAFKAKVPPHGKGLLDGMLPLGDGRLLVATALGLQILSKDAEPVLIPNPTGKRANYVRILTDPGGQRWIYAVHENSVLRRRAL